MDSQPRRLFDEEEGRGGGEGLFCARTSAGLWTNPLTLPYLRAMGSAARNEGKAYFKDMRAPAPTANNNNNTPQNDQPRFTLPLPGRGGFPHMPQHDGTNARARVNGVFAAVPGLNSALRAKFAGASPDADTWSQIGNVPWPRPYAQQSRTEGFI